MSQVADVIKVLTILWPLVEALVKYIQGETNVLPAIPHPLKSRLALERASRKEAVMKNARCGGGGKGGKGGKGKGKGGK